MSNIIPNKCEKIFSEGFKIDTSFSYTIGFKNNEYYIEDFPIEDAIFRKNGIVVTTETIIREKARLAEKGFHLNNARLIDINYESYPGFLGSPIYDLTNNILGMLICSVCKKTSNLQKFKLLMLITCLKLF